MKIESENHLLLEWAIFRHKICLVAQQIVSNRTTPSDVGHSM